MSMCVNGPNVLIADRVRVPARKAMEGDEFLLRGEPSLTIQKVQRNEARQTVRLTFTDGTSRRYGWDDKISVVDSTPERARARRNLARNGYPRYS